MLKPHRIMQLAFFWLNGVARDMAMSKTGVSPNTATAYYGHFRALVASTLEENDTIIGGNGIVVDIDETKLGKRKYNRGHRVEGVWVVVGVERAEQRRIFLVAVENRNSETLTGIIRSHEALGSIVHTDCWRGYASLEDRTGPRHMTVNHSEGFINRETGVHTNFDEGTNFALKRKIPIRCRTE